MRSRAVPSHAAIGRESFDLRAAIWALLLLLTLWGSLAHSAVWTTFTSANGLPESQVTALALTDSQTVLVTTASSIVEYDGVRFRRILLRYAVPPVFGRATCVAAAPNGDIWVGTQPSGAFQLRATDFVQHTREDGLGDRRVDHVTSLSIDPDGTVWAGTKGGGLSRYDGTSWITLTKSSHGLQSDFVSDLERAPDGVLWITHDAFGGGLSRYDGTSFQNYQRPGGLNRNSLGGLTIAADGSIWTCATTAGVGVFSFLGSWLMDFGSADGLASDFTRDAALGIHGDIWVGTTGQGLSRWAGEKWENYPASSGLADNTVNGVLVTEGGALWAGTAAGLSRFEGASWLAFDETNVLPGQQIIAAAVDSTVPPASSGMGFLQGAAYVALKISGPQILDRMVRLTGVQADTLTAQGGASVFDPQVTAIGGLAGGAWVGGSVQIPAYPPPNQFAIISRMQGLVEAHRDTVLAQGSRVGALSSVDETKVWVGVKVVPGLDSPLYLLENRQLIPVPLAGFSGTEVKALAQDAQGRLLVGAFDAPQVALVDSATLQVTGVLGAADGIPGFPVTSLLVSRAGDTWIGTDFGLALFRGSTWVRTYTAADGLPATPITRISEDPLGRIWVGTPSGVAFFDGSSWSPYGTSDGLPGALVVSLQADDEQTLIGTAANGLALFRTDRTPPRAVVTAGPPPALGARITQMAFGGGDLDSPPDFLRFSWALDGEMPRAFSDENTAVLFGLADGPHVFEVWARDRALNVTPVPARYEFEVDATPPQPIIASPGFGRVVAGTIPILGTIEDARFDAFQVAIREVGDEGAWTTLAADTIPVPAEAPLATWDTDAYSDGRWEIRLTVRDTLDLVGAVYVEVVVDNIEPSNEVTSPARINNQTGGRIFTLNAEMEVYFPPQSLDQDRVIAIQPQAGTTTPPAGASRWLGGWRIEPDGFITKKPVTLTLSLAALDSLSKAAGGEGFATTGAAQSGSVALPLGIFRVNPDSSHTFLGGSVDAANGTLTTTTTLLGPFAVYEGLFASASTTGRNADIQPRAFSPIGTTFDDRAAISFDLSGAGSVRVYVYDRVGRIVRRVHEGSLGPGRNVVYWDGRDANGDVVPSGIYLVAIDAGGEVDTKSVAVVNR